MHTYMMGLSLDTSFFKIGYTLLVVSSASVSLKKEWKADA